MSTDATEYFFTLYKAAEALAGSMLVGLFEFSNLNFLALELNFGFANGPLTFLELFLFIAY